MQVLCEERQFDVRDKQDLEETWEQIMRELHERELVVSSVEMDGIPVYDNFWKVLEQGLEQQIQQAVLRTLSQEEVVEKLMGSLFSYLSVLQNYSETVAAPFYAALQQEDWQRLEQFIEGLDWVVQSVQALSRQSLLREMMLRENWGGRLNQVSQLLIEEVTAGNHVGIGDVLLYEIAPLLEEMKEQLAPLVLDEPERR